MMRTNGDDLPVPLAMPLQLDDAVNREVEDSVTRFEAQLRKELGMMVHAVPVNRYVDLYRQELRAFVFKVAGRKPGSGLTA
jgi:hypothetical protein